MKKDFITLFFFNNFTLRFWATFDESVSDFLKIKKDLKLYYLENKRQTYILDNYDLTLTGFGRFKLYVSDFFTLLFTKIWTGFYFLKIVIQIIFAFIRLILVCLTSPQFYLLFIGLILKIYDLVSSCIVWFLNYCVFAFTATEANLVELAPLRLARVIMNYRLFWFIFSIPLLLYLNIFLLSHLYFSTLFSFYLFNGLWLCYAMSFFISDKETQLDYEEFFEEFCIPTLFVIMTEGVYVHLQHAGHVPEVIIPYAQAENMDIAIYSDNSALSQTHYYSSDPLGWYNYADDYGNIEYPDFSEIAEPLTKSPDNIPRTNAPITKKISYDLKAYHKDDHLYHPFARDLYLRRGIKYPTDRFAGDDPNQYRFSRVYYNREVDDLRNNFVYSYDLRFTILDDIKYGKLAPRVISYYMRHLYSTSKKRNGVSNNDEFYESE